MPTSPTSVMKTMAFGKVDKLVVVVHSRKPPADDEWEDYIQFNLRTYTPGDTLKYLVVTDGGAPTAAQRMILNEKLSEYVRGNTNLLRSAIVTSSTFVRGVVTALSWFNSGFYAFSPQHLEDAMRYLEVPVQHHDEIRELVKKLRKTLPFTGPPIKGIDTA
ncbi:MAG: hypothetical protein HUU21_30510 [Polyangiaceae bacterium]|nr:hypothetical protein [Polyangiaceae bacterium]NUQ77890.1 hypothetical protein [Polyangiaceae bacterium]